MNYVFDLILVAIAAITIIRCWVSGFTVSVLRFARLFICFVGALLIGPYFGGVVGYLIAFVVMFVAVTIILNVFKLISKVPVIRGIDKTLGLILGIVCAVFYMVVLSVTAHAILIAINAISPDSGALAIYESSKVFKFVCDMASKMKIFGRLGI